MTVRRCCLTNAYSLIPLHIMSKAARDKGVPVHGKLEIEESIPGKYIDDGETLSSTPSPG